MPPAPWPERNGGSVTTRLTTPNTKIREGEVEDSNFNATAGMVRLINLHRDFEYYMKVMDTFVAKDRKVIEELATPA